MDPTIYSVDARNEGWPALLKEIPAKSQPKKLYVRGTLPPRDALVIGVVGTRKPTSYGRDAAEKIVRALAAHNIVVVSGMALGIDSVAHKTALEEQMPTLAILGSGLEEKIMYPQENIALSRDIARHGALITEYEPSQKPELWTFPQRNRIIAGVSKAIVVIEAGEKSGALITARFAAEYNREVFALPGPISYPQAKGTNLLIKDGATPITSPEDILEALDIKHVRKENNKNDANETPEEQRVLALLEDGELALDEIIKKTKMAVHAVLAATAALELDGRIRSAGGLYRKL